MIQFGGHNLKQPVFWTLLKQIVLAFLRRFHEILPVKIPINITKLPTRTRLLCIPFFFNSFRSFQQFRITSLLPNIILWLWIPSPPPPPPPPPKKMNNQHSIKNKCLFFIQTIWTYQIFLWYPFLAQNFIAKFVNVHNISNLTAKKLTKHFLRYTHSFRSSHRVKNFAKHTDSK